MNIKNISPLFLKNSFGVDRNNPHLQDDRYIYGMFVKIFKNFVKYIYNVYLYFLH